MKRNVLEGALWVAVLAVVTLLAVSNLRLRRQVSDLSEALHARRRPAAELAAGDRVEPFDARDRAGRTVRVDPAASDSTLLVVDPECGSCRVILRDLLASPRPNVTVLAVSASGSEMPPAGSVANEVPLYTVSRDTAPRFIARLGGVPRVLRIASGGSVRAVCHTFAECGL
jgi:hypothetical protein